MRPHIPTDRNPQPFKTAALLPNNPQVFKFNDLSWSLWDRWILEGDLTVAEVSEEDMLRQRTGPINILFTGLGDWSA